MFTAMNAVGLVVFAWLVVDNDIDSREERLDLQLSRVTAAVLRLVQYQGDTITTAFVGEDEIDKQCPQFAVLSGGASDFRDHYSGRECVRMDQAVMNGLAEEAVTSGRVLSGYKRTVDGELVWVRAEPFKGRAGYLGAVVGVADAEDARSAHRTLTVWVVVGCMVLVGSVAFAGYLMAGRAIRPAAAALKQQETLLAETAHDLRTPVAALRALAETALRNPDQGPDLLPRTVRLAAKMGSIIDGLLVRARLAAGVDRLAVQPVWLDQLVAGVVEDTPPEGATVTLTAAPCKVLVDPTLVQRAIGNLLGNALRYGRQPDQPAVVHITVANGRVTVADNGPGIDGEWAEEAFDRWRTGSGSSGLGLSIVRWVAQAHGGTLSVYNAEGAGAIFELSLPVVG
jgi:signal transduction histidine kinase